MDTLPRQRLLDLTGLSEELWDWRAQRGQLPLAFGAVPACASKYLAIDLVAVRLSEELASAFDLTAASFFVREYFETWAESVSRAEFDPGRPYYFAVLVHGYDDDKEYLITGGTHDEIIDDLKLNQPTFHARRFTHVCINELLADLRRRGERHGIDLSAPFFVPVTHPQFRELVRAPAKMRAAAVRAFKRKQPRRAAKQLHQGTR
jgi:hypothetical protein